MVERKEEKLKGVANLFEKEELKGFFANYLLVMGLVEGFIFLVCFVVHIAYDDVAFPWRPYFFASFVAPIIITFMFGLIVIGFNKYLYESPSAAESPFKLPVARDEGGKNRLETFLYFSRQVPFLFGLLLLVLAAVIFFKLDAILLFIGAAGEKAAQYILISVGVLLLVATLVGLIWMVLSYRLRKEKMKHQFQYRKDVMEQMGLIILEDETVLDKTGALHKGTELIEEGEHQGEVTLVPKIED